MWGGGRGVVILGIVVTLRGIRGIGVIVIVYCDCVLGGCGVLVFVVI